MSSEQILWVVTAAIAVVALAVALVAVLKLRSLTRESSESPGETSEMECRDVRNGVPSGPVSRAQTPGTDLSPRQNGPLTSDGEPEARVRVVEGRVIVPPTSRQVVEATMGRPLVKASMLAHGLAHALRPESRDRIRALMRREFNSRRSQRQRMARQAARAETTSPLATPRHLAREQIAGHAWLGELPQAASSQAAPNAGAGR